MKTNRLCALLAIILFCISALSAGADAQFAHHRGDPHFVPNSQEFWDFSKNWTTNYGPAYRDTMVEVSTMLPCVGRYALCFHSGPEPLPCELTKDGRFANCECTVQSGVNFVLMTAILNERVYRETVAVCGPDGSRCTDHPNKAPVCKAINQHRLIPGADVISTYHPGDASDLVKLHTDAVDKPPVTVCPKGPYAGCMTAPCRITRSGRAECSCPVFWGIFQLVRPSPASCSLDDDLVWSSSYDPKVDGDGTE